MKKTIIKFKNLYNFTTDAIKDRKTTIVSSNFSLVCTLTHVDDDYVYGVFLLALLLDDIYNHLLARNDDAGEIFTPIAFPLFRVFLVE